MQIFSLIICVFNGADSRFLWILWILCWYLKGEKMYTDGSNLEMKCDFWYIFLFSSSRCITIRARLQYPSSNPAPRNWATICLSLINSCKISTQLSSWRRWTNAAQVTIQVQIYFWFTKHASVCMHAVLLRNVCQLKLKSHETFSEIYS